MTSPRNRNAMNRKRGGYYWVGHENTYSLVDEALTIMSTPRFFPNRPGYIHNQHLQFLDGLQAAIERGKDPVPYLRGEFRELDERTAQAIVNWWRSQHNGHGK